MSAQALKLSSFEYAPRCTHLRTQLFTFQYYIRKSVKILVQGLFWSFGTFCDQSRITSLAAYMFGCAVLRTQYFVCKSVQILL
jgi:hypothetical protein